MPQSGTFEAPSLLSYPHIAKVSECPDIIGKYCYIIEPYERGDSIVIKVEGEMAGASFGDWASNCDESLAESYLSDLVPKCITMMRCINISLIQLYISSDGLLVDAQCSINKFVGPGMLRDLFNEIIRTQTVKTIEVVDRNKIKQLESEGHWILKPSKFRYYELDGSVLPLYASI